MDFLKSSDVEVAAYVLHESKVPMYYKDLIMEVLEKRQKHRSNLYNASMPFFMRLTIDGVGLHQGPVRSYPASHGCIRLTYDDARFLFKTCDVGTAVFVVD